MPYMCIIWWANSYESSADPGTIWMSDRPLLLAGSRRDNLYVDSNPSRRAIEAGVAALRRRQIVMGTDGTKFGAEWTFKALEEADLTEDQRDMIRHDNASGLIGGLANLS